MLRERANATALTFFDMTNAMKSIPKNHILMKMKSLLDWSRFEAILKDYYDPSLGRPSDALVLLRMLILEHFANLSDRQAHEQVGYNLLYRAFVGLSPEESVPDDTTLVKFRQRLGADGVQRIFDELIKQLDEMGLIGKYRRVTDGSNIWANVAARRYLDVLRIGRRKLIEAIAEVDEQRAVELASRYLEAGDSDECSGDCEELESKEKELCKELLDEVAGVEESRVKEMASILEEMLEPRGRPVSFDDPDARWGHKSREKRFLGYKVHEAIDPDSRIITSVDVHPGNVDESVHTGELLGKEKASRAKGAVVIADNLYAKAGVIEQIRAAACKPCIAKMRKPGLIQSFDYDPETDQLICPEGKRSIGKVRIRNGYQYYFSMKDCSVCPRKGRCLTHGERYGKAQQRRRVYLSDVRKEELTAGEAGLSWRREQLKKRGYIEAKFAEQMNIHGMRRARYRGLKKVLMQVLFNALAVNLKRAAKLFYNMGSTKRKRSPPQLTLSWC